MGKLVALLLAGVVASGGMALGEIGLTGSDSYHWSGHVLTYDQDRIAELQIEKPDGIQVDWRESKVDRNLFRLDITVSATQTVEQASIQVHLIHHSTPTFTLIPAVSYNGNPWGEGPKGFGTDAIPRSYEYRRCSIPGATYVEGDQYVTALWAKEQKVASDWMFACSLKRTDHDAIHTLIYPDEERPDSYTNVNQFTEAYRHTLRMDKGQVHHLQLFVYVAPKEKDHRATRGFLDTAWKFAEKPKLKVPSAARLWELGVRYAKESLWAEEGIYKGFSIGLSPTANGGFQQRPIWKYEIGWCGNNGVLANALLEDYLKSGNTDSLQKALTCLDTWSGAPVLPNGLFITNFDYILSKSEGLLDACNLGSAAWNFFRADKLCTQVGHPRPVLKKIALGICDFVHHDQQADGRYGRAWETNGKCSDRVGTIGAFLIPGMVEAYRVTGRTEYLDSAKRAFRFYQDELIHDGYTTVGALDTNCIDCESAWPLLRGALDLYHETHDRAYLDDAETVSYYLASWQWHYGPYYPPENDFSKYGYNPFGASGTSVQHHHISFHTVCIVDNWLELSRLTGRSIWRDRALAMWRNSAQVISDGTAIVHGRHRPAGAQNEAYFQSIWNFYAKDTPSMNDWMVAWPTAFRLQVLCRVTDWSVFGK